MEERRKNISAGRLTAKLATAIIIAGLGSAAAAERWDAGQINCVNPGGDEIKAEIPFEAPPGKYYSGFSVKTAVLHTVKAARGCWREIGQTVELPDGKLIAVSYTVHAHADCGTDIPRYIGKAISVECEISYTLRDRN